MEQVKRALGLVQMMRSEGLAPTEITYNILLRLCGLGGCWAMGLELMGMMEVRSSNERGRRRNGLSSYPIHAAGMVAVGGGRGGAEFFFECVLMSCISPCVLQQPPLVSFHVLMTAAGRELLFRRGTLLSSGEF